jgi:hypothetical protein
MDHNAFIFTFKQSKTEDNDSMILQYIRNYLPNGTASHDTKLEPSIHTHPAKPSQTSHSSYTFLSHQLVHKIFAVFLILHKFQECTQIVTLFRLNASNYSLVKFQIIHSKKQVVSSQYSQFSIVKLKKKNPLNCVGSHEQVHDLQRRQKNSNFVTNLP